MQSTGDGSGHRSGVRASGPRRLETFDRGLRIRPLKNDLQKVPYIKSTTNYFDQNLNEFIEGLLRYNSRDLHDRKQSSIIL
jgi:hypothetical protein